MRGKILGVGIFAFIIGLIFAAAGAAVNVTGPTDTLYAVGGLLLVEGLITAIYGGAAKPPAKYM